MGVTNYISAEVRETGKILDAAAKTLAFGQPIALMLLGVMEFVPGNQAAYAIVGRLIDALPSGSYLVFSHPTNAVHGAASDRAEQLWKFSPRQTPHGYAPKKSVPNRSESLPGLS